MTRRQNDVTTLVGLLNWHREYIPDDSEYKNNPVGAACWYVAYQEARELLDCWTTKDLARWMCEGGQLPVYQTREHLKEWLEERRKEREDEPTSGATARTQLLVSLDDFWLKGGEG